MKSNRLDSFFTIPLTNENDVKTDSDFDSHFSLTLKDIDFYDNCYLGLENNNIKILIENVKNNSDKYGIHTSN